MHENQLTITTEVVRDLVAAQFPEWASLPVARAQSTGTVNAIFRIGDRLAARFPLQSRDDVDAVRQWLISEADAGRELAAHTSFPLPEPVAIGEPGFGYPLPWAVQTWIPGVTAAECDPSGSDAFARDLAQFITEVRSIDARGRRFSGQGRGGDLRSHDDWVEICFDRSEGLLDVPRLRRIWLRLRELPRESDDAMTHGDLIPGNVLVEDGRLAGVLDVGGVGPADPAIDLVGGWHLLDAERRGILRDELRCGDLDWERGKAWAFIQAIGLVWYYLRTNPTMSRTGRHTLDRILADEPGP
jgi:aminoglycoside phosphotransferase (APT) family kinase protein